MRKVLFSLVLAVLAGILMPREAAAQACTVSSSTTTAGTASSSCFVKAGSSIRMALTGTWVGTMQLQFSTNGGSSWQIRNSFTTNAALDVPTQNNANTLFRWYLLAYTSGTVSYSINDITIANGRSRYSTVPIGSVAYGSMGASNVGLSTSGAMADVFIEAPMNPTGLALLIGATGGTDTITLSLYDPQCRLVASTAATTVSSTANAFQQIAFATAPGTLAPGRYYVLVQISGSTATFRRPSISTFINVMTQSVASLTYGTIPATCTPPTTQALGTLTELAGPIAYIY